MQYLKKQHKVDITFLLSHLGIHSTWQSHVQQMGITCTPHIYGYDITCSSAFQILNFGLGACATKKILLFSLTFTERPPFLPTFTQWPPIFNKLLVTERPWYIFVTQRPLIFTFNSQTSDNFRQKIGFLLQKFWEIFGHFGPKVPIFFFFCISLKDPLFCVFCHSKVPFFDAICHRKTPTSEVLGGTCTPLSYVSAPLRR